MSQRYTPNTRGSASTLSRESDSNPLRHPGRFTSCQAPLVTADDRRKPQLLTSVLHEEKLKETTHRLTLPTECSSARHHARRQVVESKDVNRYLWQKLWPFPKQISTNLYTKTGSLKHVGTAGPPSIPAAYQTGLSANTFCSGGPASKPVLQEVYHRPSHRSAGWRTFQNQWQAHHTFDATQVVTKKPGGLKHYSIHSRK
ncbi:uncharacterized protein LOC101852747 [Aplysia californica]|uniref:Uncharacterized protein LOC101852747 n=1 Tax=Aplysia californica TaxID=6500 RepID=A0ABM1AE31_APLCA|nr:uncharacterized protein LOC101852747 [Aplysia californica]